MLASVSSQTQIQKQVWWMDEQTDGLGGIDGPVNELSDRWTDEQMDGWTSGWVNGWTDRHFYTWLSVCIYVMFKADFLQKNDACGCGHVCAYRHSQLLFFWKVHVCIYVKQLCWADRLSCRDEKMALIQKDRSDFCSDHLDYKPLVFNPVRFSKHLRQLWFWLRPDAATAPEARFNANKK